MKIVSDLDVVKFQGNITDTGIKSRISLTHANEKSVWMGC